MCPERLYFKDKEPTVLQYSDKKISNNNVNCKNNGLMKPQSKNKYIKVLLGDP